MIAVYILSGLVAAFLVFYVIPNLLVAFIVFKILLVRTNKKKWARNCSWDNEEQRQMFAIGEKWGEENKSFHRQASIKSGKYNLVGEYFDFGYDKTVIMVPGRMETCVYSYFFAPAYKKSGYNVLAIDNRSHGLSDGRYNTVGMKEYKDILAWAKFAHDECGSKEVFFHGICIGSATVLKAFASGGAPDYMQGLVADGMYVNFGVMLEKRIEERRHKAHPCADMILWMVKLVSGKNPAKNGPIVDIEKMKKPILFVYSKEDVYSDPKDVTKLYEKCNAKKRIVWFDKGIHSHVRINAPEKYDKTIEDFLREEVNV